VKIPIVAAAGFIALVDHVAPLGIDMIAMLQVDPQFVTSPVTPRDVRLMSFCIASLLAADLGLLFAFIDCLLLSYRFARIDVAIASAQIVLLAAWFSLTFLLSSAGDEPVVFLSYLMTHRWSFAIGALPSIAIIFLVVSHRQRLSRTHP
jgi:hypothetical protein